MNAQLSNVNRPSSEWSRFRAWVTLWIGLSVLLEAILWISGARTAELTTAIDHGVAQAEQRGVGELPDDIIRKAIQTQLDTRPFWTTLIALGDFLLGPLGLVFRPLAIATLFAGAAALRARPSRFVDGLNESAAIQGFWIAGLAVRVGLVVALRRTDIDTSATLFLPAGNYDALVWVPLHEIETFATLGWVVLAWRGWRRGQVGVLSAFALCGLVALIESSVRLALTLVVQSGIRLTIIPT